MKSKFKKLSFWKYCPICGKTKGNNRWGNAVYCVKCGQFIEMKRKQEKDKRIYNFVRKLAYQKQISFCNAHKLAKKMASVA
jgi:predicted nucleic acid-binding Zn ribbon protein